LVIQKKIEITDSVWYSNDNINVYPIWRTVRNSTRVLVSDSSWNSIIESVLTPINDSVWNSLDKVNDEYR
jgi:hypothetical protein